MKQAAAVLAMVLLLPLPARGHHVNVVLGGPLTSRPIQEWDLAVRLEGSLTPELIRLYNEQVREKPKPRVGMIRRQTPSRTSWSGSVEQWRSLIEQYFQPADLDWAMRVMACESRGNPLAVNSRSGAAGLFQHIPRYWADRSAKAGIAGADIFDPESNIIVSAWLYYHGGGARHWVCK